MPSNANAHPWGNRQPERQSEQQLKRISRLPSLHGPRLQDVYRSVIDTPTFSPCESLSARAFLSCEHTEPITSIRLVASQWFMPELARSPRVSSLRHLSLKDSCIGPEGIACLSDSTLFQQLTSLNLESCRIGDEGFLHLVRAPWFRHLKSLNLNTNQLTPNTVHLLVRHLQDADLETLTISHNALGENAWSLLTDVVSLQDLEMENVGLIGAPRFSRKDWRKLSLAFNAMGDEATQTFLNAVRKVDSLSLRGNRLTPAITDSLLALSLSLQELDLAVNPLGDEFLNQLFSVKTFPNLRAIDLTNTLSTTKGVQGVLARLRQIPFVNLSWNAIEPSVLNLVKAFDFTGCPTAQRCVVRRIAERIAA